MNEDAAHKVSRIIASVCRKYPGCILLFERLRKIKRGGGSKSRRMNRRQSNQLRGKINQYAKDKNYAQGTRHDRSQSPWNITVLLPMRRQGREVLVPQWRVGQRKVGENLPMSRVSLRSQCRS